MNNGEDIHWILILLLHIITVGGILFMGLGLFRMIWEEKTNTERVIQFSCIVVSLTAFIILTFFDFSFIEKIFKTSNDSSLNGQNMMLFMNILFGVFSAAISYYLIEIISQSFILKRVCIVFFSMFFIVFIQLYVLGLTGEIKYLVVGSSFLFGVMIYLILRLPYNGVFNLKGNNTSKAVSRSFKNSFPINKNQNKKPQIIKKPPKSIPPTQSKSASDQIIDKLK